MTAPEYRVTPVTRYVLTRLSKSDAGEYRKDEIGEYKSEAAAQFVMDGLARAEAA